MPSYSGTASVLANLALGGSSASWVPSSPTTATSSWSGIGNYTDYLVFTGFGFSIPSTEEIIGITVSYAIQGQPDTNQTGCDNHLFLTLLGASQGADHALSDSYSNVGLTTKTRGGIADAWGTSLTYADVNGASFGFKLSSKINGGAVGPYDVILASAATINITTMLIPVGGESTSLMQVANTMPIGPVRVF
jgi:hypothetical protein